MPTWYEFARRMKWKYPCLAKHQYNYSIQYDSPFHLQKENWHKNHNEDKQKMMAGCCVAHKGRIPAIQQHLIAS